MTRHFIVLGLLLVFASGACAHEPLEQAKAWSYAEMTWDKDKALPSVQRVLLWGDPATGEHGMLRKFPAGYAPPPHKHPSVERVLVLSGTIIVQHGGSQEKSLGPGSYSEIPPNTEHAVQCSGHSECVFLLTSSGLFKNYSR